MKRLNGVQMESIIDQLRVHDGKLFQNEIVLTVYVDLKRMVLNNILIALSTPGGLKPFLTWTEELETDLVKNLLVTEDLFQRALAVYANELRSEIRNPFGLRQALKAMFHRLCGDPFVVDKQILSLDPIKQDFILREVFRRSLSEGLTLDSLVQLPPPTNLVRPVTPPRATTPPRPMSPVTPNEFAIPEGGEPETAAETAAEDSSMPDSISIAHSVMAKSVAKADDAKSVARSVARSVAPRSVAQRSVAPVDTSSVASSSTMTMKRPNIRRVIIDDDASTVFTARK